MNDQDVTIIIVNWNTQNYLRNCLKSVYEQTQGIRFDVIVVDNDSTDNSTDMVKQEFPEVHLIKNKVNRGFSAANNQAMEIAKGRYVLLLNSDTVTLDGAVQKTVSFADQNPEAGVIGCRVLNSDRSLQPTCFMYPGLVNLMLLTTYLCKLFPRNRFFGRERMTWWDRDDIRQVEAVTGCFMLVRNEAIQQVGMMDESFFMYAEETDWCYRLHKAGWKLLFTPDAQIIHLGGGSSRLRRHEMTLNLLQSVLLFHKKHKGAIEFTLACFLLMLFFLFRIPFWLLKTLFFSEDRPLSFQKVKTYFAGAYTAFITMFRRNVKYLYVE